jgi:hypothetical protein
MIAIVNGSQPCAELEFEIERLRRLAYDLNDIRQGRHPGRKILEQAPTIEDWRLAARPTVCLTGRVSGHPHVREDGIVVTTDLWVIAPALGYARTLSRFYALGRPGRVFSKSRH